MSTLAAEVQAALACATLLVEQSAEVRCVSATLQEKSTALRAHALVLREHATQLRAQSLARRGGIRQERDALWCLRQPRGGAPCCGACLSKRGGIRPRRPEEAPGLCMEHRRGRRPPRGMRSDGSGNHVAGAFFGCEHGVGHPLLFLCDTKAAHW